MKIGKLSTVLAALAMLLHSCTPIPPVPEIVAVDGITLSETEITVLVGEEESLSATVTPSDATDKTVVWKSSDEKVATVRDGRVKGIAEGSAVITAAAGGRTATCNVTVRKPSVVETGDVTGVSYNTASVTLQVFFKYAEPGAAFEDAGIIYGKKRELDFDTDSKWGIDRDKDGNPDMSGSYTVSPIQLEEATTYYYQAYAIFGGVKYFGEVKSFQTTSPEITSGQAVDMGLSVKWAGWNVGAAKPEEPGEYYVWGSTDPASKIVSAWVTPNGEASKYGAIDGKTVLDLDDDAAAVRWGDKWRMPTEAEKRELEANTQQTKYTLNGVPGYVFTSLVNGASIFIPAAGYSYYGDVLNKGKFTTFWTSTLCPDDERGAAIACDHVLEGGKPVAEGSMLYELGFYWECATSQRQMAYRWWGCPIRAVYDPERPAIVFHPQPGTFYADNVTDCGATFKGSISFPEGTTMNDVTAFGVLVANAEDRAAGIPDIKVPCDVSEGAMVSGTFKFSHILNTLGDSRTYMVCTYIECASGTFYGAMTTFKTLASTRNIDLSAKKVDLGLSVAWAGWNIGAAKPQEAGGYYCWAETEDKKNNTANENSYKYYDKSRDKYTKYVPDTEKWACYGQKPDNYLNLRPLDDAAFINWGESWRTPTREEWKELKDKCKWEYTSMDGMYGYIVTGPSGKSIFLPFGGSRRDNDLFRVGEYGSYWTDETVHSGYTKLNEIHQTHSAHCVSMDDKDIDAGAQVYKYYGHSVRAVWGSAPLEMPVESICLDKASLELHPGDTETLTATLTPSDVLDDRVIWTSSDASVATVSNGLVTALTAGSTVITAKSYDGGKTATCDVTVSPLYPAVETAGFVDLGLSVKWAACNLGASSPEKIGDRYAWGNITPGSSFAYEDDRFYTQVNGATYWAKYTIDDADSPTGVADRLTRLEPSDDVAALNTDGRMPTAEETQELIDKCTFRYGEYVSGGISYPGYFVTGPSGKTIFFPPNGSISYGSLGSEDVTIVWTSDLTSTSFLAQCLSIDNYYKGRVAIIGRTNGICVRAVK